MCLLISRLDILRITWKSNSRRELHENKFLIAVPFLVEDHALFVSKLKILANAQPHHKCPVISKVE